jgi:hypothetical protein
MHLPGTNDFTLGPSAHTDIGALGSLVTNKEPNTRKGKDHHSENGVGGRVTEPSLGKSGLVLLAQRFTFEDRATRHHAALKSSGAVMAFEKNYGEIQREGETVRIVIKLRLSLQIHTHSNWRRSPFGRNKCRKSDLDTTPQIQATTIAMQSGR